MLPGSRVATVLGLLVLGAGLAGCRTSAPVEGEHRPPVAKRQPSPAPGDLPPAGDCGDVWCKYLAPPVVVNERRTVLCSEATCDSVKVPPVWECCTQPTCVCPPTSRCVETPAEYEIFTEKFCVEPAHYETRRVPGPGPLGIFNSRCQQVLVPARIDTRQRKVLMRPQYWNHVWTCGKSGQETRTVLARSGAWNDLAVPGRCATVECCREVAPSRWEWRKNDHCTVPAPCAPPCAPCAPPVPCAPPSEEGPPVVRSSP